MVNDTPKRKIKDSVFTNLFQDKKYLLQLYKALHPEDNNVTEDEIDDITIKKVYNEQRKLYGATKNAILKTIRICKDRNVLKEYLENKEQEVVDMMMTLFDDEQILKAYKKDIARETARETAKETAREMIKDGEMPLEKIARYVPSLSMEELKTLQNEVMQLT